MNSEEVKTRFNDFLQERILTCLCSLRWGPGEGAEGLALMRWTREEVCLGLADHRDIRVEMSRKLSEPRTEMQLELRRHQ